MVANYSTYVTDVESLYIHFDAPGEGRIGSNWPDSPVRLTDSDCLVPLGEPGVDADSNAVADSCQDSQWFVWSAGDRVPVFKVDRRVPAFDTQEKIDARIAYNTLLVTSAYDTGSPNTPVGIYFDNTHRDDLLMYPHVGSAAIREHPTKADLNSSEFKTWYWEGDGVDSLGVRGFLQQFKNSLAGSGKLIAINIGAFYPSLTLKNWLTENGAIADYVAWEFSPHMNFHGEMGGVNTIYNFQDSLLAVGTKLIVTPNDPLSQTANTTQELYDKWAYYHVYTISPESTLVMPSQYTNDPSSYSKDGTLTNEQAWALWMDQENNAIHQYDLGIPIGDITLIASGTDGVGQTYQIYKRDYTNGMAVVRAQFGGDVSSASLSDSFSLGGTYNPVGLDGVVDTTTALDSLALRNREGKILQGTGLLGEFTLLQAPSLGDTITDVPLLIPTTTIGPGPYAVWDPDLNKELPVDGSWFKADSLYSGKQFRVYKQASNDTTSVWPTSWTGVFDFEQNPQDSVLADRGVNSNDMQAIASSNPGWPTDNRVSGVVDSGWSMTAAESLAILSTDKTFSTDGDFTFAMWCSLTTTSTDFIFQSNPSFWQLAAQASSGNPRFQFKDFERPGNILVSNATDISFDKADSSINSTTTDFVAIGISTSSSPGGGKYTFQITGSSFNDNIYKVNPDSAVTPNKVYVLAKNDGNVDPNLTTESAGNPITITQIRNSTIDWDPSTGVTKNEWHHFAISADSTTGVITAYVDGSPQSIVAVTDADTTNFWDAHQIGGPTSEVGIAGPFLWNQLDAYDGGVDEARIIDYSMNDIEISVMYGNQKDPDTWWTFASGDIQPPILDAAASVLDSNTIRLSFSEALDVTTAEDVTNYSITPSKSVVKAVVTNNTFVTLTVSDLVDNETYTITVNNVEDLNGNIIAPNSTATGTYFDPDPNAPILQSFDVLSNQKTLWVYWSNGPITSGVSGPYINSKVSTLHRLYIWDGDSYLDNLVILNSNISYAFSDPNYRFQYFIESTVSRVDNVKEVADATDISFASSDTSINSITTDFIAAGFTNTGTAILGTGDGNSYIDITGSSAGNDGIYRIETVSANKMTLTKRTSARSSSTAGNPDVFDGPVNDEPAGAAISIYDAEMIYPFPTNNWYVLVYEPRAVINDAGDTLLTQQGPIARLEGTSAIPGPDFDPPTISSISYIDSVTIQVQFSEVVDSTSAILPANYLIWR